MPMTDNPSTSHDPLGSEASLWIIHLTENPHDPALRREFSVWFARSPAHAHAWARALHVWRLSGAIEPVLFPHPSSAKTHNKSAPFAGISAAFARAPSPATVRRTAVACALSVAFCAAGALVLPDIRIALQADYRTSTGKNQTITLADGSIVTLGARSAIAVHYRPQARDITLLAGEAFFQVRHNAERPFRVTAGATQARDIGTRFDIGLDSTEVRISVQEGLVGVSNTPRGQELVLGAGEEIRVDRATGGITRETVVPDTIGSWQTGMLVVSNDTVGHVTNTLRRYYSGYIVSWNPALLSRHVGGVYDLGNIPAALRAAVVPSGGRVREVTDHMLIATAAAHPRKP